MTQHGIAQLKAGRPAKIENGTGRGVEDGLSEVQWAVVDYTDAMTKEVQVPDEIFAKL